MNRPKSCSVPCRHVLVKRIDRFRPRHLSVFLIHIMCARSRVVSDPNAKVFNLLRAFLVDLYLKMLFSNFDPSSRIEGRIYVAAYHSEAYDLAIGFFNLP